MKLKTNRLAEAVSARHTNRNPGSRPATLAEGVHEHAQSTALDFTDTEMERRLRAQHVWEFLDEGKSTFYARMNANEPSYDPLFPAPIPSSTTGKGPKRWKKGDVIAWMRMCEANANYS